MTLFMSLFAWSWYMYYRMEKKVKTSGQRTIKNKPWQLQEVSRHQPFLGNKFEFKTATTNRWTSFDESSISLKISCSVQSLWWRQSDRKMKWKKKLYEWQNKTREHSEAQRTQSLRKKTQIANESPTLLGGNSCPICTKCSLLVAKGDYESDNR